MEMEAVGTEIEHIKQQQLIEVSDVGSLLRVLAVRRLQ